MRPDASRQQAGASLLERTDELGFGAIGAAWIYSRETERWWFMLVSPMVDTKGPIWIYERLTRVFAKWRLPDGMTPLDIRIISPNEMLYRALPLKIGGNVAGIGTTIELENAVVAGVPIDFGFFYGAEPAARRRSDPSRRFYLRVRQLDAA